MHLLQSVFMLIDWSDTLHFELRRADGQISREDLGPPLPPDDLMVRAARALQQASATHLGRPYRASKSGCRRRPAWAAARPTPPAACWR